MEKARQTLLRSEQRLPRFRFGDGRSQHGGGCQGVVSRECSSLSPRPVKRFSQRGACSLEALDVARGKLDAIKRIDGLTEPLAPGLCGPEEPGSQLELPLVTRKSSKSHHGLDNPELSIEGLVDAQSSSQHRRGLRPLTRLKLDIGEVVENTGDEA